MIRRLVPVALLLLAGASVAYAQVPSASSDLMLSWRSNGFAPAGYEGRVSASGGGTVLLTAEALVNGRPANLSNLEIRWYVNDELFTSGFGLQAVSVPVARFHQDSIDVRVEIIGAPFSATLASMSVPLTDPVAVIEPKIGTVLYAGENPFIARPYSFNVTNADDLVYIWRVNGEAPATAEDPAKLSVIYNGIPTDPLNLSLNISHPQNSSEGASAILDLVPASVIQ
jgi:hypothetical protein